MSEQTSGTQHEIVMTDAQLEEREEWVNHIASLQPEDDQVFEEELDRWEASR